MSYELRSADSGAARRRRRGRGARGALLWGWALFGALQSALLIAEYCSPGLWQPQYAQKLALLRRRLAEAPGRPLVLFMGTSRTLNGLRPADLSRCPCADGAPPVVFNFAHAGAGPRENRPRDTSSVAELRFVRCLGEVTAATLDDIASAIALCVGAP